MTEDMRLLAAASAAAAALALAGSAAAAPPNVATLLLSAKQVGASYQLLQRNDGLGLGTRTLDLCGTSNYPSETLRAQRVQVDYLRKKGTIGLSNEVVRYKSAAAAAQAMHEVTAHAVGCPHHPVLPGEQNLPPLTFTITLLKDSHLLKGYLSVRVRTEGIVNGKMMDQTSYAVYQRLGSVLSGVYSFGAKAGQEAFCLHAAEQSALDLRRLGTPVVTGPTA